MSPPYTTAIRAPNHGEYWIHCIGQSPRNFQGFKVGLLRFQYAHLQTVFKAHLHRPRRLALSLFVNVSLLQQVNVLVFLRWHDESQGALLLLPELSCGLSCCLWLPSDAPHWVEMLPCNAGGPLGRSSEVQGLCMTRRRDGRGPFRPF